MKDEEFIERYGLEKYLKRKKQTREWEKKHPERVRIQSRFRVRKWNANNPEKVKELEKQYSRKGGKHYKWKLLFTTTGVQGERHKIRVKHAKIWRRFKKFVAQESQLHHQWRAGSAEYDGVALVEKDQHRQGFVKVILILEGIITLATEKEIRER